MLIIYDKSTPKNWQVITEFSKKEREVFDLALKKSFLVYLDTENLTQSAKTILEVIKNLIIT